MSRKIILLLGIASIVAALSFLLYEAKYPSTYSQIKKGMTEEEVIKLLQNGGFVLTPEFGRFKGVWIRKQVLGEWVFDCSYDKNAIKHLSAWYHLPNCGEYVRARNKDFSFD
jgi:hypothetical protein